MKDDSLADTQQDGYEMKISQDEMTKVARKFAEDDIRNAPDYCYLCDCCHDYKVDCQSVGKPLKIVGLDRAMENVYEREVWNKAIEAAAEIAEINSAADIRKLKK